MTKVRFWQTLFLSLFCLLAVDAFAGEEPLVWSSEVAVGYDSNVGNAGNSADSHADNFQRFGTSVNYSRVLGRKTALRLKGTVDYQHYNDFSDLSSLTLTGKASYDFLYSANFFAPTFTGFVSFSNADFRSAIRDSLIYKGGFEMNQWLSDRVNVTTGIDFTMRRADGVVFDGQHARLFGNLDWYKKRRTIFYGSAAVMAGDTTSTGRPTLQVLKASEAVEIDEALGGLDVAPNQFAYRIQANTLVLTIGGNHRLGRKYKNFSFDVSARGVLADAEGGIRYHRVILNASLLGQF